MNRQLDFGLRKRNRNSVISITPTLKTDLVETSLVETKTNKLKQLR